ncbi:MAG: hypothetical protein AABY22_34285, partial [Nanoarchaeota archaeon]
MLKVNKIMSTKNCNRCKKMMNVDMFKIRNDGNYYSSCIECNKVISANKLKSKKLRIMEVPINKKQCKTCFKILDTSSFKTHKSGLSLSCMECQVYAVNIKMKR